MTGGAVRWIWLVLAGCAEELPAPSEAPGSGPPTEVEPQLCPRPFTFEPGTGLYEFAPIVEGDLLTIERSATGTWHVWIAGAVAGSGPAVRVVPNLTVTACPDCLSKGDHETATGLPEFDQTTCTGTFWGVLHQLSPVLEVVDMPMEKYICTLEGQELDLTVTVADYEDPDLVAERTLRVVAYLDRETISCDP